MRGGLIIWTSALLMAASGIDAAAGPTSYSGPLPRLAVAVAGHDSLNPAAAFAVAVPGGPGRSGPALDLAAAGKLRELVPRGCEVEGTDPRLHLAAIGGAG